MSNTKCPFCGKHIRYLGTDLFTCDACHIMLPAKHWLAYINTRKALGVALDWLREVATPAKCDDDLCREFTERKLAEIKKILESKDAK